MRGQLRRKQTHENQSARTSSKDDSLNGEEKVSVLNLINALSKPKQRSSPVPESLANEGAGLTSSPSKENRDNDITSLRREDMLPSTDAVDEVATPIALKLRLSSERSEAERKRLQVSLRTRSMVKRRIKNRQVAEAARSRKSLRELTSPSRETRLLDLPSSPRSAHMSAAAARAARTKSRRATRRLLNYQMVAQVLRLKYEADEAIPTPAELPSPESREHVVTKQAEEASEKPESEIPDVKEPLQKAEIDVSAPIHAPESVPAGGAGSTQASTSESSTKEKAAADSQEKDRRKRRKYKKYIRSSKKFVINPSSESEQSDTEQKVLNSASTLRTPKVVIYSNSSQEVSKIEQLMMEDLVNLEQSEPIEILLDDQGEEKGLENVTDVHEAEEPYPQVPTESGESDVRNNTTQETNREPTSEQSALEAEESKDKTPLLFRASSVVFPFLRTQVEERTTPLVNVQKTIETEIPAEAVRSAPPHTDDASIRPPDTHNAESKESGELAKRKPKSPRKSWHKSTEANNSGIFEQIIGLAYEQNLAAQRDDEDVTQVENTQVPAKVGSNSGTFEAVHSSPYATVNQATQSSPLQAKTSATSSIHVSSQTQYESYQTAPEAPDGVKSNTTQTWFASQSQTSYSEPLINIPNSTKSTPGGTQTRKRANTSVRGSQIRSSPITGSGSQWKQPAKKPRRVIKLIPFSNPPPQKTLAEQLRERFENAGAKFQGFGLVSDLEVSE